MASKFSFLRGTDWSTVTPLQPHRRSCVPSKVFGYRVYERPDLKYTLIAGPFRCDRVLLMSGRPFDWGLHIERTFHRCMAPMVDRFMRVV